MSLRWRHLDADEIGGPIGLPVTTVRGELLVEGNFAVVQGCADTVCRIYVARLDTEEVWAMSQPSGVTRDPFGMTETELVMIERDAGLSTSDFQRLVRLELSAISSVADEL